MNRLRLAIIITAFFAVVFAVTADLALVYALQGKALLAIPPNGLYGVSIGFIGLTIQFVLGALWLNSKASS